MLKMLADENFNGHILRGLLARLPAADVIRVQDIGISGADDRAVLEWGATAGRILLTHYVKTMSDFAFERVDRRKPMPGVFLVKPHPIAAAIDGLILAIECSQQEEWENQVVFVPF